MKSPPSCQEMHSDPAVPSERDHGLRYVLHGSGCREAGEKRREVGRNHGGRGVSVEQEVRGEQSGGRDQCVQRPRGVCRQLLGGRRSACPGNSVSAEMGCGASGDSYRSRRQLVELIRGVLGGH